MLSVPLFVIGSIAGCSFQQKDIASANNDSVNESNNEMTEVNSGNYSQAIHPIEVNPNCVFFIGRKKGQLIFRDCMASRIRILGLLKNNQFELIKTPKEGLEPLFVNDGVMVYKDESRKLVLEGKLRKEIHIEHEIISIFVDPSLKYLTYSYIDGENLFLRVSDLSTDVTVLSIPGANPHVLNSNILFYEAASAMGDGFVDLLTIDINKSTEKGTIVKGIFGEHLGVSPDGRYIACNIPITDLEVYSIYSVKDKKFYLVEEPELANGNFYPAFEIESDSIVYYEPNSLRIIKIPMPRVFDYNYSQD